MSFKNDLNVIVSLLPFRMIQCNGCNGMSEFDATMSAQNSNKLSFQCLKCNNGWCVCRKCNKQFDFKHLYKSNQHFEHCGKNLLVPLQDETNAHADSDSFSLNESGQKRSHECAFHPACLDDNSMLSGQSFRFFSDEIKKKILESADWLAELLLGTKRHKRLLQSKSLHGI